MLGLISDLIAVGLVLLGLTMICAVWGRATFRLIGISTPQYLDCGTLWLGFTTILALIELLHLFVPIDWRISAAVLFVSLLPFMLNTNRLEIIGTISALLIFARLNYFKTFMIGLIGLLWCLRSMGLSNNFDSGLYHFGSIRWLNEYALVPGLGNIHWRFGLNQSYFGFLSLVNIYPLWNKGYAVGGLFLLYLAGYTLINIGRHLGRAWGWLIGGVLFIYLGYIAGTLPNPSPDTAVGLVEIAIFLFLFRIINKQNIGSKQPLEDSVVILCLSLALVTIKLSGVVFAATSVCLVVYFQYAAIPQHYRTYFKLSALLVFFSSMHILRGYLLSGLPLFPSTVAGAWGLDWAVSNELVKSEINLIYSWGRQPGELLSSEILGHWGWISSWLETISLFDGVLFSVATALLLINLILGLKGKTASDTRQYLALYLPVICTFIFWFLTAPDVRFLGAVPSLYLALSLWIYSFSFIWQRAQGFVIDTKRHRNLYWMGAIFICFLSLKSTGLRSVSLNGWTPLPAYKVNSEKTYTDLPINVSADNGQCWNAPLPCLSIFNGNIHADPWAAPWPLSILTPHRFFYSVKFLNLPK